MSEITHDRLQAECFQWLWNTYPGTRKLCFACPNEQKLLSFVPAHLRARIMGALKAIGLVTGVYDLLFYWKGVLYAFDMKVGKDRLSKDQQAFGAQVIINGGFCYEIRDFEQFKAIIERIFIRYSLDNKLV